MRSQRQATLYVGGYLGEILRLPFVTGYFRPIERYLKKQLPGMKQYYIQNPLHKRVRSGTTRVGNQIMKLTNFENKSLVVIAHSRGALETWTAILQNPYLLRSRNLMMVHLMSSPIGGSQVAKFFSSCLRKVLPKKLLFPLLEMASSKEKRLEKIYSNLPEQYKDLIAEKVRFHTTQCASKDLPWFLKAFHALKGTYNVCGDGLLKIEEQSSSSLQNNCQVTHWSTHHGSLLCNSLMKKHCDLDWKRFTRMMIDSFKVRIKVLESPKTKETVTLSTYNTGLLDIPVWGIPHCDERIEQIPEALANFESDFVCIQEAFKNVDDSKLVVLRSKYIVLSDGPVNQHGLVTLVRKDKKKRFQIESVKYTRFSSQRRVEPMTNFQKGYLISDFNTPNGRIRVINLHFTAFSSASRIREKQLEELSNLVLESIKDRSVFIGGDFNMSFGLKNRRPTYSTKSSLAKIKKAIFDRSERIDHVFGFCKDNGPISPLSEAICFDQPQVEVNSNSIELSDHYLLKAEFQGAK